MIRSFPLHGTGHSVGLPLHGRQAGGGASIDPTIYAEASPISAARLAESRLGVVPDTTVNGYPIAAKNTLLCFQVRGTSCTLKNAGGSDTGPITVVVDGGTRTTLNRTSGETVLFTGLTDDWHTVSVIPGDAFGDNVYIPLGASDALTATGSDPKFLLPNAGGNPADGNLKVAGKKTEGANSIWGISTDLYSNHIVSFSGRFSRLIIGAATSRVYVSIDGAMPTAYDKELYGALVIDPPQTNSTFYIWTYGAVSEVADQRILSIGALGTETLTYPNGLARAYTFGHSITEGLNFVGTTNFPVTYAAKKYLGASLAKSGLGIPTLLAALPAALASIPDPEAADIAVVDIGRNDGDATLTAGEISDYNDSLDLLVAKGFQRIFLLGQMPISPFEPEANGLNASIEAIAVARPSGENVSYISRAAYGDVDTTDGTHPSPTGFSEMVALDAIYFAPSLPTPPVDSTSPVLSSQTATASGTTIDIDVTSDEAGGTIYAALRLSTDGVLSKANIKDGTGDAVDTASLTFPIAGVNELAFAGVSAGTYVADIYQVDRFGNESAVVSTASATVAPNISFTSATEVINDTVFRTTYTGSTIGAAAGSDRLRVLAVHYQTNSGGTGTTLTATIGGVGLTLLGSGDLGASPAEGWALFYSKDASLPSGTVEVVFSASVRACVAVVVDFADVDQTTTFGTPATNNTFNLTVTRSITTTAADSMILTGVTWRANGSTALPITESQGGTLAYTGESGTASSNDIAAAISYEAVPTASAEAHTYVKTGGGNFVIAYGVEILTV
jgi:hypothetical protein